MMGVSWIACEEAFRIRDRQHHSLDMRSESCNEFLHFNIITRL